MLTSDLNLSKNCKRIEILKCVLRTFITYLLNVSQLPHGMAVTDLCFVKPHVSLLYQELGMLPCDLKFWGKIRAQLHI